MMNSEPFLISFRSSYIPVIILLLSVSVGHAGCLHSSLYMEHWNNNGLFEKHWNNGLAMDLDWQKEFPTMHL